MPEVEALLKKPIKNQTDGSKTCVTINVYFVLDIDKKGVVIDFGKHQFSGENKKVIDAFFDKEAIKKLKFRPRKIKGQLVDYQVYVGIDFIPNNN